MGQASALTFQVENPLGAVYSEELASLEEPSQLHLG